MTKYYKNKMGAVWQSNGKVWYRPAYECYSMSTLSFGFIKSYLQEEEDRFCAA